MYISRFLSLFLFRNVGLNSVYLLFLADSSHLIERKTFSCFPDIDKLQYLRQLLHFLLDECK